VSIRAQLTPRAMADLRAAVVWIAKDSPMAARGFSSAVVAAAERISKHPLAGVSRPELAPAPYRFCTLGRYPYLVVYNAQRRPPSIVRIVHGARDLPDVLRDLFGAD
jgi:toxin ParE1/3/4